MADHSIVEAQAQAVKALRYFAAVLEKHEKQTIAVRIDDTVLVVATGAPGKRLKAKVEALDFNPRIRFQDASRAVADGVGS